jgi:hypothetical protein
MPFGNEAICRSLVAKFTAKMETRQTRIDENHEMIDEPTSLQDTQSKSSLKQT